MILIIIMPPNDSKSVPVTWGDGYHGTSSLKGIRNSNGVSTPSKDWGINSNNILYLLLLNPLNPIQYIILNDVFICNAINLPLVMVLWWNWAKDDGCCSIVSGNLILCSFSFQSSWGTITTLSQIRTSFKTAWDT